MAKRTTSKQKTARALEVGFPFEAIHPLAELESWRKEVNRPVYHIHKWWANRLGSVFRAIVLAGNLDSKADVWRQFYERHDFRDCIVLDPFMGSGTTIGEAIKLGCRVVGCDINPVSYFQVRKALEPIDEDRLRAAYARLEKRVAPKIRALYQSSYAGEAAEVLYAFWVKVLNCPDCGERSRLFSSWIFSSNAYPGRKPESKALCPHCGDIVEVGYTDTTASCGGCRRGFNPQQGPAQRQKFTCEACGTEHRTVDVVRASDQPPAHEMYALMLLLPDRSKVYKRPDAEDLARFARAKRLLKASDLPIPQVEIEPGFNTNQARGYGYLFWHQMFNERQLYCLGTLLGAVLEEEDVQAREFLLLLFSGVLEFNNMFCSFKGEGTGAVRHMFSHHILKPERTPLEANPWGTEKSSGSFSTMFERRLLSAKRYCRDPFELRVVGPSGQHKGEKVFGINKPIAPRMARSFGEVADGKADALLLARDSSKLPIPDESVDLVVTDPPYFDNVHYSELADFFYCWLRLALGKTDAAFREASTRSEREVQGTDSESFGARLGGVLAESARVLKKDGLLAFTFHHSREDAWSAVVDAIRLAGLVVVAAHPVKAEMSVAAPKTMSKEPIDLDLVIVCRRADGVASRASSKRLDPIEEAKAIVERYAASGIKLSAGDLRVILMGSILKDAAATSIDLSAAIEELSRLQSAISRPPRVQRTLFGGA